MQDAVSKLATVFCRHGFDNLRIDQVGMLADEEIIAHLPTFGAPAKNFAEMTATRAYDLWGIQEAERKSGVSHSHHVIHLPGEL